MNTTIKYACSLIFLLQINAVSQANGCEISHFTTQHMILLPQQYNSSNMAFSIQCPHSYSIRFNSANNPSSEGIGHLRNRQHFIRTKMSARSDQVLPWAVPIQQNAHQRHNYVVTASVLDRITPITPAGVYRDRIQLQIEF